MVELVEQTNEFADDPVTQETFLSSVKSWYPNGVHIGIEKIYMNEKEGKWGKFLSITLKCSILDDMSKCRARVIGKDGKVVQEENAMGDVVDKIEIIEEPQEVTLFLSIKYDKDNEELLNVGAFQSVADFIRPCFICSGLIPSDWKGGIKFTQEELEEALDGYECLVQYGKNERASRPHPIAKNL